MRKAILHLKKCDPVMRGVIARIGPCRITYSEPVFHSLAEAIVYQQLNGKAAETIFKRFTLLSGDPITPAGILKLTPDQMRSVGLSKQKSAYLIDMAERAQRGELDFSRLPEMSDDEVIEHLTQVKGVGVWTAHMFLMFTLRRPNILPVGDFGVRMRCTGTISTGARGPARLRMVRVSARARQRWSRLSCRRLSRWRKSPSVGNPIAASRAGTYGKAWTQRRWGDRLIGGFRALNCGQ